MGDYMYIARSAESREADALYSESVSPQYRKWTGLSLHPIEMHHLWI